MSETESPQENQGYEPGLKILKLLCFLTFVGSGLGLFAFGMIGAFYGLFSGAALNALMEEQQDIIRMLLSAGRLFFLLNALMYIGSLYGAFLMLKMKKLGFHFYTISQIFILILPMVFIKGYQMPWMNVILTSLFILAYSSFFKKMS